MKNLLLSFDFSLHIDFSSESLYNKDCDLVIIVGLMLRSNIFHCDMIDDLLFFGSIDHIGRIIGSKYNFWACTIAKQENLTLVCGLHEINQTYGMKQFQFYQIDNICSLSNFFCR